MSRACRLPPRGSGARLVQLPADHQPARRRLRLHRVSKCPTRSTGELITIYNLNPAKQGLVDLLDTTADRIAGALSRSTASK